MFEFRFIDSEFEALENLLKQSFANCDSQRPTWVYLGHDMWNLDLGTDSDSGTQTHPDDGEEAAR